MTGKRVLPCDDAFALMYGLALSDVTLLMINHNPWGSQ